ncbi:TonB-dependent receptor domain-containing protein [Sphingobium yanoikuyae]|uniref:TonB-dependent receptor n=1 Tax=Sphingobium yanoikuyae TaxID=13690 RepID=A0A430BQL6_SPHYA|nr:TonB-dependent receptor [Sphingobium yanoikuyae]RSU55012.1 TonB-dependent receptor [Sphingobium yanoikuyae]
MTMIRWMVVSLAALAFAVPASAQTITPDHGGFVLKRPLRFSLLPAPLDGAAKPARIYAIELAPSPAEPAAIGIAVQRKRNRMVAMPARRIGGVPLPTDLSGDAQPRSSLMLVDAHGSLPLADGLQAELGWQGAKLNNRGANVTALYGSDAIKSRDLFLPTGRLAYDAAPGVTLRADYRETIEAYAGVGLSGALGLTREAFRTLQAGLRPERDSRMRLGSDWMLAPDLTLAVDAFDGEIEDRLAFVEDGYLPVNRGSAHVRGLAMRAEHRLTSALSLSARYHVARLRQEQGGRVQEQQLMLEGLWAQGPWRCRIAAAQNSAPALMQDDGGLRLEAGVDYALTGRRPMRVGLHLTDPDQLASSRLMRADASGAARPEDQAQALMLTAARAW